MLSVSVSVMIVCVSDGLSVSVSVMVVCVSDVLSVSVMGCLCQ